MKKVLKVFEARNGFEKALEYERAWAKKGLEQNKSLKADARRKPNASERLLFLEEERKRILGKKSFFKNEVKEINYLINNTSDTNLSQELVSIKYYNKRKLARKKQAFELLASKLAS